MKITNRVCFREIDDLIIYFTDDKSVYVVDKTNHRTLLFHWWFVVTSKGRWEREIRPFISALKYNAHPTVAQACKYAARGGIEITTARQLPVWEGKTIVELRSKGRSKNK